MRLSVFSKNSLTKLQLIYLTNPKLIVWLVLNTRLSFLNKTPNYRPYYIVWRGFYTLNMFVSYKTVSFYQKNYSLYNSIFYYFSPSNKSFLNKHDRGIINLNSIYFLIKHLFLLNSYFKYTFIYLYNTFLRNAVSIISYNNRYNTPKPLNIRFRGIWLL